MVVAVGAPVAVRIPTPRQVPLVCARGGVVLELWGSRRAAAAGGGAVAAGQGRSGPLPLAVKVLGILRPGETIQVDVAVDLLAVAAGLLERALALAEPAR